MKENLRILALGHAVQIASWGPFEPPTTKAPTVVKIAEELYAFLAKEDDKAEKA